MAEGKASNEYGDAGEYGIEEIEGSHGTYADEVEERPLNT